MQIADKTEPLDKQRVANAISRAFLDTVPAEFHTHCVLCSRVVSTCLDRLGLPNRVVPCQLVCTYQDSTVFLGFTGTATEGRWDGHAVVQWQNLLFDFATASFKRDYGFELPKVLIAACATFPSNLTAKIDAHGTRLMWLRPPLGADTDVPEVNPAVIARYSELLLAKTRRLLA